MVSRGAPVALCLMRDEQNERLLVADAIEGFQLSVPISKTPPDSRHKSKLLGMKCVDLPDEFPSNAFNPQLKLEQVAPRVVCAVHPNHGVFLLVLAHSKLRFSVYQVSMLYIL